MTRQVIYRAHFAPAPGAPIGRPSGPNPVPSPTDVPGTLLEDGTVVVTDGLATVRIRDATEGTGVGQWRTLGGISGVAVKNAITFLGQIAADPDPIVARAATEALAVIRTTERGPELLRVLTTAATPGVSTIRVAAIQRAAEIIRQEIAESGRAP